MICPDCRGRGFVPVGSTEDLTEHAPCGTCGGSGVASCCDAAGAGAPPSFTCPRCGRVSYNPNDIRERYCGACHQFVDDTPASYRDDTFPERLCDACGHLYRGRTHA